MKIRTLLAVCFMALLPAGVIRAQETPPSGFASDADRAAFGLKSKKYGAVIIDVLPTLPGCEDMYFTVSPKSAGAGREIEIFGARRSFGQTTNLPMIVNLEAGEYSLSSFRCRSSTIYRRIPGPFAQFSVRANELVNVGRLKVEFKWNPKGNIFHPIFDVRKSIVAMDAADNTYYKGRLPNLFSRITHRRMTMAGAAVGVVTW